jgi:hypothetical protein
LETGKPSVLDYLHQNAIQQSGKSNGDPAGTVFATHIRQLMVLARPKENYVASASLFISFSHSHSSVFVRTV